MGNAGGEEDDNDAGPKKHFCSEIQMLTKFRPIFVIDKLKVWIEPIIKLMLKKKTLIIDKSYV